MIDFDVSWNLATKPHPKKRRLDKSTRDLIAVDTQHIVNTTACANFPFTSTPKTLNLGGWLMALMCLTHVGAKTKSRTTRGRPPWEETME
jgi:hypothetical protein